MRRGQADEGGPRLRVAALGVGLVALGLVALALWSEAEARLAAAARRPGARFSNYIDDLPIMPGLVEAKDGYAFDLIQGGQLAEARLAGDADPAVVRGFYAATLTQLGWRPSETEPYIYHRGPERLIFLVEPRRRGGRPTRGVQAVFVVTPDPTRATAAR